MDLATSCKDKLAYFRIKELKDVLTQLGLSKQGKKQDLVDRILGVLADEQVPKTSTKKTSIGKEEVAKLVDDIYRKMQVSGATDLASKGQGVLESSLETGFRCCISNNLLKKIKIHLKRRKIRRATMEKKINHPISLFATLCVVLFILSSSIITVTEAEVITLTPDTFSDKVKEKDTAWFVKFCVPWCKHCKNLGTLWEDFGKVMEGEDEIEVGEVDCGLNKALCSKVDIHSYPTFKLFYDGEAVVKYNGTRDVESLKSFALEEAEKAAAKAQLDNDQEL
ncbi:protein disulfide-isomerase 5-1 isoform X2 [Mercurialis annua]|uniref:protein disulfide-isomerase 5-1 isoform X2 n=1 Tax=Mercurialis annua TaxID=3986 RepID=UPI0024AEE2B7|nr:protein disulfide-isomerase 5-1 isoform X2 [Mercurialis annua]